jgi:hypothetical protein
MAALGKILVYAQNITRMVTEEWDVAIPKQGFARPYNQQPHSGSDNKQQAHAGKAARSADTNDSNQGGDTKKPRYDDCNGCGRIGHKRDVCKLRDHPDFNKSGATWSDSTEGKQWAAKREKTLPAKKSLSGAPVDFVLPVRAKKSGDVPHTCLLCDNTDSKAEQAEGFTLRCGLYGAAANYKTLIDVLVDTGALQANYISNGIADWLTSRGVIIKSDLVACLVCNPNGCQRTKQYAEFDIEILNIKTNKNEIIPVKAWLLQNCPYDLILGRPTIISNNLLDKTNISGDSFRFELSEKTTKTSESTQAIPDDSKCATDEKNNNEHIHDSETKKSQSLKSANGKRKNTNEDLDPTLLHNICEPMANNAWQRQKKQKVGNPTSMYPQQVWEDIATELRQIAEKMLQNGSLSEAEPTIPIPALTNARSQGVAQTTVGSTTTLGPSDTASAQLHALYLLEKETYDSAGKSVYTVIREPKENYIDYVEDDDHIDYEKQPRPCEDDIRD